MPDFALLRRDAHRAYERGRFVASLRVGFLITPIAFLCMWETGAVWRTLALAVGLFGIASALRWRLHRGFQVVGAGLRSGVVPLAAALALCRFAPACPPDVAIALCASAGLAAGGIFGRAVSHQRLTPSQRAGAAAVGGLMAALGCLALGVGSAVAAAAGIAAGVAVSAQVRTGVTA